MVTKSRRKETASELAGGDGRASLVTTERKDGRLKPAATKGEETPFGRMALPGESDTPYLAFTVQREYTLISL